MARDFLSEVDFKSSVTLTSTDDGSAAAPELKLYRNSASPADADYIGQIKFQGENDNDQKVVYAKITGKIGDASDTSEDGIIEIAHQKAGSNNISARFTSDALKLINGTGLEVADGLLTLGSTAVTSTAAELNILDGVTSTTAELNILDGVTASTAELNILDGVTSTASELNLVDGITAGTVSASLAVIADSNKDVTGFRNVTLTGELDAATLDISGNADIDGTTNLDDVDIDGTVQIDGAVTVGVDDTGVDVKFFGATSGKYMLWDESADSLIVKDTVDAVNFKVNGGQGSDGQVLTSTGSGVAWENATGGGGSPGGSNTQIQFNNSGSFGGSSNLTFDGTNLTLAGDATIGDTLILTGNAVSHISNNDSANREILQLRGKTALSDSAGINIYGAGDSTHAGKIKVWTNNTDRFTLDNSGGFQLNGTVTVGVDDTGHDVKFFGATSGKYMLWDESIDTAVVEGKVAIGHTTAMRELDVKSDIMIHHPDLDHAWLWSIDTDGNNEWWYQSTYSGGDSGWGQRLNMSPDGDMTLSNGALFATAKIQTGQSSWTQEPWAASTISLGDYGSIGTQGSYRTYMSWNYERGTDSNFHHLDVNSYPQAGHVAIGNTGILFGFDDDFETTHTSNPTTRALVTSQGLGVGDGSGSSPSIFFTGDTDSGFYLSGSGLSVTTAGSQRAWWSTAGRLHLAQIDDVDGDAVSGSLIIGGDGTGSHLAFDNNEIQAKSSATAGSTLYVNMEGGTVKTKGELHVHHSGIAMTIQDTSNDTGSYIQFTDTDGDQLAYIGCPNNDDIHIKNTNTSGYIYVGVTGATSGYCAYWTNTGDFLPYNNVQHNLGASGVAWEHFYLGQGNTFSSGGYWTLRSRDSDRQVMEYTSSERFKKDIVDLPLSEAYQVLNARPIKFRGADDDSSVPLEAGLSAESLHNAGYEYAVRYDEGHWGETPRSIYYDQLTAPLIKICKDQKDRIESLEAKVAALESA
tara:strand:- start:6689 stop:9616 length:2928 start_codon:yes stop_codon:yes gene_type:complete